MPVSFPVLQANGKVIDQDCLTVSELAQMLRTTRDAVYRKTSAGEWPYFRIVRRVYFTPDHVVQILALADHQPLQAPNNVRHIPRGEAR